VKAAAETFAPNPKVNVVEAITQLGVGEALVSTLQEGGVPMPVERALITSPGCRIGTITPDERKQIRARSPVGGKYDTAVDRDSAFETLSQRAQQQPATTPATKAPAGGGNAQQGGGWTDVAKDMIFGTSRRQGMLETMAKSVARNAGGQLGRSILRGVLGSMSKR
jgi:DNA helicase HerA-like ATPase